MHYWLLSLFLGAFAVLQGGINRQIAKDWGLSMAILFNSLILASVASAFWILCHLQPQLFPVSFAPKWAPSAWRWWYVFPAFCGFALVAGIPAAIPKIGATSVFICMVVGQMIFSVLWDAVAEQIPPDPLRMLGVALVVLGLIVSGWRNLVF